MHSCAKVFCSRLGERSGPVQKGDSTTRESMRSLLTVPVPPDTPLTVPATYDGTTFGRWPAGRSAAAPAIAAANGAGGKPARYPVT